MAARKKRARSVEELLQPPEEKPKKLLDCAYGCGNAAEGTLYLNYSTYDSERSYAFSMGSRSELSCHVPACRKCVRGAATVRIAIPPPVTEDPLSYRPELYGRAEEAK